MKKFLLMFAAVAAIAFVGCKTETAQPADEQAPAEEQVTPAEPTVETVTADLMNAADEPAAFAVLDGLKAKAEEFLKGNENDKYFNIINIIKTVWDNCKDQLGAKFPGLVKKINDYITVPDNLKDGFAAFVENAAKQAADKVEAAGDAVADKANEVKEDVKDAAKDAVNNAADAAKEAVK